MKGGTGRDVARAACFRNEGLGKIVDEVRELLVELKGSQGAKSIRPNGVGLYEDSEYNTLSRDTFS